MSKTKSCADSDGDKPPQRPKPPRIPPAVSGIQYNFCKNPACVNYGIEPTLKTKMSDHDFYTLSGDGKGFPLLKCKSCGEMPPLKSNAGLAEELARIAGYLEPTPTPSCPNPLTSPTGRTGAGPNATDAGNALRHFRFRPLRAISTTPTTTKRSSRCP